MAVNLDGRFWLQAGFALLKQRGGAIVNLSSCRGRSAGQLAAYNASKGGVRLLTKSVALRARIDPQVAAIRAPASRRPDVDLMLKETSFPMRPAPASPPTFRSVGSAPAESPDMCVYLLSDEIPLRHGGRVRHRRRLARVDE